MSLSAAKLALAVKRARAQSGAPELLNSEPIAIIGLGCRLPGAVETPDAFWSLLRDGVDAIIDLPRGRWPSCSPALAYQGGFLKSVDGFDAGFFGIPPREAERLDPQHRLLMEVIWESLWDARLKPEMLAGGRNGVFAAVYNNDYFRFQFSHSNNINAYTSTGTSHSTAVGRISFLLDWKGPSVTVDTACSSSLVAVHMACQSLRAEECRMAVAGGVSLILAPEELISLGKLGMLAGDWRCKTFDARADGFVPGEGCGIVVLKRLSDALADGDTIHAVIRGTAVNQDGRTTVLTAPNGLSQQAVVRSALANAQVASSDISYVEAHGTGTTLGDPIEVEALGEVLGEGSGPCVLGSVKSNLGHLEAAAGVTGLIKTVLALKYEEIPRSLHFRHLNPHIQLAGTRLAVADRRLPWPRGPMPRFAGVSSFGFGGTNAHVVLEEAPVYPAPHREPVVPHVWKRERHWFTPVRSAEHPLLGRRLKSPALKEIVFENALGADAPQFLGDHRPRNEVVLPLTAYLEMFLAASGTSALEDVIVREPLQLPTEGTIQVQVIADEDSLRLFSEQEGEWRLHATARTAAENPLPAPVKIEDLRHAASREQNVQEFYAGLENRGLNFGPAFRRIEELWIGPAGALAHIRPFEPTESYRFHPALLDACLQGLGTLLPEDGAYLPIGLRRFALFRAPGSGDLWSHGTTRSEGGKAMTGDVRVFDSSGEPVATVEGLWLRKPAAGENHAQECLCEIAWQPQPFGVGRRSAEMGTWLVFSDAGEIGASVAAGLEAEGRHCLSVRQGDDFEKFLTGFHVSNVLFLWSLDAVSSGELNGGTLHRQAQEVCSPLLRLVQALAGSRNEKRPRLWIVTRGAQRTSANQKDVSVLQSSIWGLTRTIRREHPDLRCTNIDLDPRLPSISALLAEILRPDGEEQIAWRDEDRLVPRLVSRSEEASCVRLRSATPGRLEELRWEPGPRHNPGPGEVEIRVAASGLNFRDVLNALGEYPGDAGPLGSECTGWIEQVGEGVTGLAVGDEVVAVAQGSFARFVTTRADLVAHKPTRLGMEEAAALPVAYVTARYALETIGKLRTGARVLIHAAAGGVGLAAVAEAHRIGAEVFATAGSDEKRAYLRSLGVRHVMNSRALDYGCGIRERTGGRGVDLVLNSLAGEHIAESLAVLATGGTYLELGKKGIWSAQRAAEARPDIRYVVIEWGEEYTRNPELIAGIYRGVIEDLKRGLLKALPYRTFAKEEAVNAFRWMAQARHLGKVVVRQGTAAASVRPDAAYLITGGLGALGLQVAGWMAAAGAGELVLVGRNAPGDSARAAIRAMEDAGTRVIVRHADVSRREEIASILDPIYGGGKPLKGIVHAAGLLDDGVLTQQSWDRFARVIGPKAESAWHLHELTAGHDLDFFIMFSSLASILGSPGQGNYATANAFLDGLAHYRHILGLPALSINWGPWDRAGMAVGSEATGWQRSFPGIEAFNTTQGHKLWEKILLDGTSPQVAAFLLRPVASIRDLERRVLHDNAIDVRPGDWGDSSRRESRAAELHGRELLVFLRNEAAKIMGIQDANLLDVQEPLFEAGLDSLMAVEFRNVLAAAFDRPFSATLLFDHPTLQKMAAFLESSERNQPISENDRWADEIQSLEEWDAEALLKLELERGN